MSEIITMESFINEKFNTVNLRFSGKPSEEQRTILKNNGWLFTSLNGGSWYPHTSEAKNNCTDFIKEFKNKYYSENKNLKNEIIKGIDDIPAEENTQTVELLALIKDLREQIEIQQKKISELENILASKEEVIEDKKNKTDEDLILSPKELSLAKSVLPPAQYVSTLRYAQGEERDFFINKIKEISNEVENAPKLYATDGAKEHKIVLRYFHPTGTETLVTEIGQNGEAFGFQCLNDNWEKAEWGYLDLNEIKNIRGMEIDFHIPEGMTVERYLKEYENVDISRENQIEENIERDVTSPEFLTQLENDQVTLTEDEREKILDEIEPLEMSEKLKMQLVLQQKFESEKRKPKTFILTPQNDEQGDIEPEDFASLLNKNKKSEELEISSEQAEVIMRFLRYNDWAIYIDQEDHFHVVDFSKNFKGTSEIEGFENSFDSTKDIIDLTLDELEHGDGTEESEEHKKILTSFINQRRNENIISYFVKSTAEFEQFEDFEPITNLTADEAVKKYEELQQKNINCGIGINIKGDSVFSDPDANGETILVRNNGKDTFGIYGDTFVKQLKEDNEHSRDVIFAFEKLYNAAKEIGLNIEDASYIEQKKQELFDDENIVIEEKSKESNVQDSSVSIPTQTPESEHLEESISKNENDENNAQNESKTYWNLKEEQNRVSDFDKDVYKALKDYVKNPNDFVGYFPEEKYGDIQIADFEKSHINYLLNHNADLKPFVYAAATDAFLGDDMGKLLKVIPESEWKKIRFDKEWCAKTLSIAEKSITNDGYLTIRPTLDFAEKIGMLPEALNYCKNLENEVTPESPSDLESYKDTLKEFEDRLNQKDAPSIATNYVLEKLKAAGIEVITDKEEFDRILQREEILQKMQGTLSDEEQKRYFTFNEEDTQKFIEQVDEWNLQKENNKTYNPGKLIEVGKIPPVMKVLGIAEVPISVQYSTLTKMVRNNPLYPNDYQGHKLSVDDIYAIPSQLADPVMVFKSRTRDDSFVFFTERKDNQNRTILIPLAVNKRKGRIVINEITSMYGRNNEVDFVKTNIDEGNLVYLDKKRSLEWERECKVQFLTQGLSQQGSNLNILTKDRLVNFISADSRSKPVQTMVNDGTTYGFTFENKIYLNPEIMNSNVAVHEYTHLWDEYTKRTNSELWNKGKNILKNIYLWNEIKNNPDYADIADNEDLLASEVHSRICGEIAQSVLERIAKENGEITKDAVIDWDKEVQNYLEEELGLYKGNFGKIFVVNDIRSWFAQPIKDLMNGRDISVEMPKEQKEISEPKTKSEIKQIREQCKEILKKADSEITEDDKKILAQYEGAGGLNEENRSVNGVLNEFYTPNNLVQKVWKLVDFYAPNAKSVMEPSSGIGKFAVNRPNNNFTLHEIDETSARIAKILHPNANVIQGAYQEQFFDENKRALKADYVQPKYDVVIGNPPYGVYSSKYKGLGEGKEFDRYEEYFISKGLDALKDERSILAFVVPSGFLNSVEDSQKKLIASKGQLIDAYRLPEGTFGTTDVGTDIILMEQLNSNSLISFGAETLSNNDWFKNHPEKILGKTVEYTDRWGKSATKVVCNDGLTVQDELNKIDKFVSLNKIANQIETLKNSVEEIKENPSVKEEKTQSIQTKKVRSKKEKWNINKSKGELMSAQEFCKLYGKNFNENELNIWKATDWKGDIDFKKLSSQDINYIISNVNYIEKDFGVWTHKELFLTGDIYLKIKEQEEIYKRVSEEYGEVTANDHLGKNIPLLESVKNEILPMSKIRFGVKTPLAEEFLTTAQEDKDGNMVALNLQEAFILWCQNTNLKEMRYREDIDFANANISNEELGEEVSFLDIVNYIDGKPVKAVSVRSWRMDDEEKAAERAERKKEADLKRQARSDIANKLFERYLHEGLSYEDGKRLEAEYNRRFNSYIAPDYSRLPLFVDGMSAFKGEDKFKLYDQQIKGISFLCNKGNGLLAYDVGVGKTAAGIVATVNQIQTGRSKRPLVIVPNQVYSKWYTDIRELFPNIKVNDLYNFGKDNVADFINNENIHKLNIEEGSISLCTYEALKNISFTDSSCENELFADFANLLSIEMDGNQRENAISSDKIKGTIGCASYVKNANYFFFEDCGFDNLTVDEAHNFKNLWVVPRPKNKGESNEYAGIPSGKPSARALKMYAMTQLVQAHNDNRNVFMLTATPFTNSPTEVYSMLSYIGRQRLNEAGIRSLRSFFDEFAQTKQELGVTSNGNIDTKQVMKNWKNLTALQNILTEFIDKVDGEEAGIVRPYKFTHLKPLDMSELQKQMREMDEARMAGSLEDVKANSADIIVAMNNMRLFCVAPALANPQMYPGLELPPFEQLVETSPKLKFVCDAIIDMYKDNPEKGQFMYVPLGKDSHGVIKNYLIKHGIPKEAVEIINGEINNSVEKKEKITSKFNDEKDPCKIIIGGRNTAEGIDLNGNSFVMYNCSLGWNPSETIQAEGRIWRQGNKQGHVHIVYPVMNDSIDSVLYQKHDEKRSRINELWNYKGDSLNVEDINPEDLKLELIKDPAKKAKLILQEASKESRAELSKINLRIKDFDEIVEAKKQLSLNFDNSEDMLHHYESLSNEYKEQNLEVPEWIKSAIKKEKITFSRIQHKKDSIEEKLANLNLVSAEDIEDYIHKLNVERKECEEKIKKVKSDLPNIMEKIRIEQLEEKLMEYPVEKQREILEADILNNLRPMSEVEYEVKTARFEKMLNEKLKASDITKEEYELFKKAGYKKYEELRDGKITSLEETKDSLTEEKESKVEVQEVESMAVDTKTYIQPSLFDSFEEEDKNVKNNSSYNVVSTEDTLIFSSDEVQYFNFRNDDKYLTPQQLTKSELKRDQIVLPILNGKESGMYKAFNDFAKHAVFDILGTKIELTQGAERKTLTSEGWQQLSSAMNIYRSKEFETFRYILIDKENGEINEQLALSSFMPNACKISAPGSETLKQVISRAEETNSLVVAVHNHPSGHVRESKEDIEATNALVKNMQNSNGENLFAGHIILDHDTFNLFTLEKGWGEKINWENASKDDELINKNFAFSKDFIFQSHDLANVAVKINDVNNWNDNFIPVVFVDSKNMVSGLKLYDKSFFEKSPAEIRNTLQFNGLEAGASMIFPIVTQALSDKMQSVDRIIFEDTLKDLVHQNAFTDAVIIDDKAYATVVSEKYKIKPGIPFSNVSTMATQVNATWETKINPQLFQETKTLYEHRNEEFFINIKNEDKKLKFASGMER